MKTKLKRLKIFISSAAILTIILILGSAFDMLQKGVAQEEIDTIVILILLIAFLIAILVGGIYIVMVALLEASAVSLKKDLVSVQYTFLPSVSFSRSLDFKQFTIWNFEAEANTEKHVRASLFVNLPYLFVVTEKTEGNFHTKWELPFEYKKE